MAIPKNVHVDRLDVSLLRGPLLDEYYGSAIQRADVMAIAEEIKRRHMAKLPVNTGNLKSTAKVTARRSAEHRDRRYEAEYSIGGPRADYIVPLEDEHHWLDETLREMGFYTGDIVNGPTGRVPAVDKQPAPIPQRIERDEREADITSGEQVQKPEVKFGTLPESGYEQLRPLVEKVTKPGRRPGSKAMERDVAELRAATEKMTAERGPAESALGRQALGSYEFLKRERATRDAERLRIMQAEGNRLTDEMLRRNPGE